MKKAPDFSEAFESESIRFRCYGFAAGAGSPALLSAGASVLAATGLLLLSAPKRVRYGMNGVTSNGIFSRSATVPTGLLLIKSSRSFQGSIFTRPPSGSATILDAAFGSVGAGAAVGVA